MPFLPIAERELRVAARRPGTYRVRWLLVLLALGISVWWFLEVVANRPVNQQGIQLFLCVSAVAAVYCLVIGPVVTADSLSEEKREGTLGLLFLTDLKGYDVVLGKLAASSVNAAYGLVGLLPLLAIPLLLGGIPLGLLIKSAATLVVLLALSLSVGMLVSSLCKHERQVIFYSIILLGLLCFGPLIALLVVEVNQVSRNEDLQLIIFAASPLGPCADIVQRGVGLAGVFSEFLFWSSLAWSGLLALLGLVLASAVVSRSWQDKPASVKRRRATDESQSARRTESDRSFRARLLDRNPLAWLGVRDRDRLKLPWIFIAAMLVIWVFSYFYNQNVSIDYDVIFVQFLFINGFLKIWIIILACSRIAEDRRTGALELLLSTPVGVREMVEGHRLAISLQFQRPLLVFASVQLLIFGLTLAGPAQFLIREEQSLLVLVFIANLVIDSVAFSWIGLWRALVSKHLIRAIVSTIILAMLLPVALHTGLDQLFALLPGEMEMRTYRMISAFAWLAIGLGINLLLVLKFARPCLLLRFREIAAERFQSRREG